MANEKPNLMDMLLATQAEYFAGELTDLQYIAAINITLDAETQRREVEADPEGWGRRMHAEAERLGIISKGEEAMRNLREQHGDER